MEKFNELKKIILDSAKKAESCKEEYAKAYKSTNDSELLQVIKDNFIWSCDNLVLTGELIDSFKDIFNKNQIWHNESIVKDAFIILSDNSSAELFGNSSARLLGNSSARLSDNSSARLFGNSSARLFDNSSARLFDNSSAELSGNSYCICNSTIECRISDSAIVRRTDINTIEYSNENINFKKV